jgi:PH (Pleckstrin Homology) domain-containing protein
MSENCRSKLLRDGVLTPTECVKTEVHASRWFYFPGPIAALLLLAFFDYAAASGVFPSLPGVPQVTTFLSGLPIHLLPGSAGPSILLLGIFVGLSILAAYWWLSRFLEWASDVYVVTNDRLIEQSGIVRHEIREIPLSQVRNIDVDQASLIARVLRYGSLRINSLQTGKSGGRVSLEPHVLNPRAPEAEAAGVELWVGVPNPIRLQEQIEEVREGREPQGSTNRRR